MTPAEHEAHIAALRLALHNAKLAYDAEHPVTIDPEEKAEWLDLQLESMRDDDELCCDMVLDGMSQHEIAEAIAEMSDDELNGAPA